MSTATTNDTLDQIVSLPTHILISRYVLGVENFDRRLFDLDQEQVDRAFLADAGVGTWPVRVLLGHLADAEVAFVHRMRRAVAEEGCLVSAWDENAFIDHGLYGSAGEDALPIAGSIAVIHALRRWATDWLRTLPPESWEKRIMHPERGEMTLRDLVARSTWHLEHHTYFLQRKIDLMLGPRKTSCGPRCSCH